MADFNDILDAIQGAVDDFNKSIPAAQRDMLGDIQDQIKKLDTTSNGTVKSSVGNLKIVAGIKAKLQSLILTDKYLDNVKDYISTFETIATLQNEYWTSVESTYKPSKLLQEIKNQAVTDTVNSLTEQGIGSTIAEDITNILQTNITSGGSYRELSQQLSTALTDSDGNPGLLSKYAGQITTDAINQYSAQYTQAVAADLDFEWFQYTGADILTSRPFCLSMTMPENQYFHVSEIPEILAATNLYYIDPKTGVRAKVPIYDKTGLPHGMIAGTNASNFQIRRGGYNCGHQVRPVFEVQVPKEIVARIRQHL